jgi:curli biogenesis system outer membrane secretion channel CsgG
MGCTHTITYKLSEKEKWTGPKIDKVVCVETFVDKAPPQTAKEIENEKQTWRTNYRGRYVNKEISQGVSDMIARHLAHCGMFKKVVRGSNAPGADWLLRGEIAQYSSMARVNFVAEGVGIGTAGFGAIGALIGAASTAGAKTDVRTQVQLDNIGVSDRLSGKVLWTGSVSASTNFTAHWRNADEPMVFRHADESLKQAVADLIRHLAKVPTQSNTVTAAAASAGTSR